MSYPARADGFVNMIIFDNSPLPTHFENQIHDKKTVVTVQGEGQVEDIESGRNTGVLRPLLILSMGEEYKLNSVGIERLDQAL